MKYYHYMDEPNYFGRMTPATYLCGVLWDSCNNNDCVYVVQAALPVAEQRFVQALHIGDKNPCPECEKLKPLALLRSVTL